MTKKSRLTGYDLVKATSDVKKKIQILESLIAEKEDEVSELSILFQNTKIALNIFLGKYNSIVGLLYIKLDKLELKVKKYKLRIEVTQGKKISPDDLDNIEEEAEKTFIKESQHINDLEDEASESHEEYKEYLEQEEESSSLDSENRDELKRLYRKLALRFHPDLAKDDKQRYEYLNIMMIINEAYRDCDLEIITKYIRQAEKEEKIAKETPEEKLVRLKEEYDVILNIIAKLDLELEDLKASETYKLKVKVDKAKKEKRDLLQELADDIKKEIRENQVLLDELVDKYKEITKGVKF